MEHFHHLKLLIIFLFHYRSRHGASQSTQTIISIKIAVNYPKNCVSTSCQQTYVRTRFTTYTAAFFITLKFRNRQSTRCQIILYPGPHTTTTTKAPVTTKASVTTKAPVITNAATTSKVQQIL